MEPDNRLQDKHKQSGLWGWVWPIVVVALVLAKAIGLVAGIVAVGAYFAFKPRFGNGGAVTISCVLALLAGVAVVAMLEGA